MMLMMNPRPRGGVNTFPLDDDLVLYEPASTEAHVLNPTAARIWALCDGEHTVEAISREIAEAYGLDQTQVYDDVRSLVDALVDVGLLVLEEQQ